MANATVQQLESPRQQVIHIAAKSLHNCNLNETFRADFGVKPGGCRPLSKPKPSSAARHFHPGGHAPGHFPVQPAIARAARFV